MSDKEEPAVPEVDRPWPKTRKRMTRSAYEALVAEDLAWLDKQPSTLESRHIRAIVETSIEGFYGERCRESAGIAVHPSNLPTVVDLLEDDVTALRAGISETIARAEHLAEEARYGGDHLREHQLSSIARDLRKIVSAEQTGERARSRDLERIVGAASTDTSSTPTEGT